MGGPGSGRWKNMSAVERFWLKVDKNGPIPPLHPDLGPCWIWHGTQRRLNRGQFWDGERQREATHYSLSLAGREVSEGHEAHHVCEVTLCVNPNHLECVTRAQHCVLHGRGVLDPGAFGLSGRELQVLRLFCDGYSYAEVGKLTNISPDTVSLHLVHSRKKLGIKKTTLLIKFAHQSGLLGASTGTSFPKTGQFPAEDGRQ